MTFVIKEGRIAPVDGILPEGASPNLIELWEKADTIQKLVPEVMYTRLVEIRDTLNAAADGGDIEIEMRKLVKIERQIQSEQADLLKAARKSDMLEILLTLLWGILILIIYFALRAVGFVASGSPDAQYTKNVIENLFGATGWATLGFSLGMLIKRVYWARTRSFADIAAEHAQRRSACRVALINMVIVVVTIGSIYFGIPFIEMTGLSWSIVEVPRSAFWPGIIFGLTAPHRIRDAMG